MLVHFIEQKKVDVDFSAYSVSCLFVFSVNVTVYQQLLINQAKLTKEFCPK